MSAFHSFVLDDFCPILVWPLCHLLAMDLDKTTANDKYKEFEGEKFYAIDLKFNVNEKNLKPYYNNRPCFKLSE